MAEKLSPADKAAYKRAFKYADKGNWEGAAWAAAKAQHPLPAKALQWMRIGDNRTTLEFREIVAFINANPHWPHQLKMQRRAEAGMNENTSSEDIYGWFRTRKPLTGVGAFHLTRA
ncbi:MAG: lytic transglycosylase domain-containing protein, partial [Pseudomonadota bacterium]|nr:lytic transglycosylase domain-containing protein [Pseudomonadota bacterium]